MLARKQKQERGKPSRSLYCSVLRKDKAGQDEQPRTGEWALAVPDCLVPGPGLILGSGNIGLVCQTLKKRCWGVWTLFVSLHKKGGALVKPSPICMNWLVMGEAASRSQARSQMSEHQEYRK